MKIMLNQKGFTLIELMVVIVIAAILAAIAIPAYLRYQEEAHAAKITEHYDSAVRSIKAEFARRVAALARGESINALSEQALLQTLDPESRGTAPFGGPAYVAGGANDVTGAVGVSVVQHPSGQAGLESVIVRRPAFSDIVTAETVTLRGVRGP
jgi:prepilin-type N-terminal cleavage/methylation domain-containing protein